MKPETQEFTDYVKLAITSPFQRPKLNFHVGSLHLSALECEPGLLAVSSAGGSPQERGLISKAFWDGLRLAGYIIPTVVVPGPEERLDDALEHLAKSPYGWSGDYLGGWPGVMDKAKRLIDANQVTVARNGYNNVVGTVVGDHGTYQVELGRDDPSSRALTSLNCECPWGQEQWGRMRNFKKYEGRPCSHQLALYWKSLATPLDGEAPEGGPTSGGAGGPSPGGGEMPETPSGSMGQPPQQEMIPSDTGIIPQQEPLPPYVPGTAPYGFAAPPNAVSEPGARPPTPANPLNYPGGVFSKVDTEDPIWDHLRGETGWEWNKSPWGHYEGADEEGGKLHLGLTPMDTGGRYISLATDPESRNRGMATTVMNSLKAYGEPLTGDTDNPFFDRFDWFEKGPQGRHTYSARKQSHNLWHQLGQASIGLVHPNGEVYTWPEGEATHQQRAYDLGIDYDPDRQFMIDPAGQFVLEGRNQDDMIEHIRNTTGLEMKNYDQWQNDPWRKMAAETYQNGDIIRLNKPTMGLVEGPPEHPLTGTYMEVNENNHGEVLEHEPSSNILSAIFPLHNTGANEPWHVRMYLSPEEVTRSPLPPPGSYIRRTR